TLLHRCLIVEYTSMSSPRPSPAQRAHPWQRADYLMLLGLVIGSIVLTAGVLALLADYLWTLHLTRAWAQISGSLVGTLLIGMVIWGPRLRPWPRAILLGIAVL